MRLLIVSNRLPVAVTVKNHKTFFHRSFGGLALGMDTYLQKLKKSSEISEFLWIGWPGMEIPKKDSGRIAAQFKIQNLLPVFLSNDQVEKFYNGFSNDTLWPLFHLMPTFVHYDKDAWDSYREVNELFAAAVAKNYREGDLIWAHDYHLMLLPKLIRKKLGDGAPLGFFLHIPFPPFEIFRLLPEKWRSSLLQGVLGADLIGFHTYDYTQYFNNSVQRILGYESNLQEISADGHITKIDTFPMGIDFQKFNDSGKQPAVQKEVQTIKHRVEKLKVILSIDRLDYTKGIIKRLKAYGQFLEKNKQWRGKVVLMMVLVPSRTEVPVYQDMKKQVDELVGQVNGRFGSVNWVPIIYQFKSLEFEQIAALYSMSSS